MVNMYIYIRKERQRFLVSTFFSSRLVFVCGNTHLRPWGRKQREQVEAKYVMLATSRVVVTAA